MEYMTTVTQKGQVTIPAVFRKRLGISRGKKVRFVPSPTNAGEIILQPLKDLRSLRGVFQTNKRYNKNAARETIIADILAGKV